MKTSAVICEFNPFHNGHAYLLQEARKRGATHIITIMSGNFTQRGEPAIFDKYTRTRAALMCGADLVAELPLTYAAAYAERFAYGGVYLAKAFGCTNELVFGSESGDADAIIKAAKAVSDSAVRKLMKYELSGGMTFAAAREKAVFDICGNEISDILGSPNDILGVEYCKALLSLNSAIRPVAVKRIGAEHDSHDTKDEFASASALRGMLYNNKSISHYLPDAAKGLYDASVLPDESRIKRLEAAFLYRLRSMSKEEIALLPEISEGLENRIFSAVHNGVSYDGILSSVKTKRYTMSRIRRIMLYALLGIEKRSLSPSPQYIRVLGMNERGKEIIRASEKTAALPFIVRYSDAAALGDKASDFKLETKADDIYALSGRENDICGRNCTTPVVIL